MAKHRHNNSRKSEEEIAKALVSNERKDYLFGLKEEYNRCQFYITMIADCDTEITNILQNYIDSKEDNVDDLTSKKPYKRQNKNDTKGIDLNVIAYQCFDGVDLLAIPGVSQSCLDIYE